MRVTRVAVLCSALATASCASPGGGARVSGFHDICGPIGTEEIQFVLTNRSATWEYTWRSDRLELVKQGDWSAGVMKAAPRGVRIGDRYSVDALDRVRSLLPIDKKIGSPFVVSHSGKQLLAAVYPASGFKAEAPTNEMVWIDLVTPRIKSTYRLEDGAISVAISPDEKHFAVLQEKYLHAKKTLKDSIGSAIGHPAQYTDIWIRIYDESGVAICNELLVDSELDFSGYVVWKNARSGT